MPPGIRRTGWRRMSKTFWRKNLARPMGRHMAAAEVIVVESDGWWYASAYTQPSGSRSAEIASGRIKEDVVERAEQWVEANPAWPRDAPPEPSFGGFTIDF